MIDLPNSHWPLSKWPVPGLGRSQWRTAIAQLIASAMPGPAGVVALVVVASGAAVRVATPSLLAWISVMGPRDMRSRALKALSAIKGSKEDS